MTAISRKFLHSVFKFDELYRFLGWSHIAVPEFLLRFGRNKVSRLASDPERVGFHILTHDPSRNFFFKILKDLKQTVPFLFKSSVRISSRTFSFFYFSTVGW